MVKSRSTINRGIALVAAGLLWAGPAHAQGAIQQLGAVVAGHLPMWAKNGALMDAGGSSGAGIAPANTTTVGTRPTGLGVINSSTGYCDWSGYATAAYSALCWGFDGSGNGLISLSAVGGGTPVLDFLINGQTYQFPGNGQGNILGPNVSTINEPIVWANTAGTLAKDGLNAPISHTGTFGVTGATTLTGAFGVTGDTTLTGNLTVTGLISAVVGATTLKSLHVTNNSILDGNLQVAGTTGVVDINASGNAIITGNASVTGAFGVTGAVTLGSTLGVTGAGTVGGALAVTGALGVTGVTTLGNSLTATAGLTQFGSTTPVHVASGQTTAPPLTSCGTSPSDTGSTDTAGTVTMGTGTPTGCVITFSTAYVAAPHCTVTWRGTPLAAQSYAVSTTAITLAQTATSSNLVDYLCVAKSGG